MTTSCPKCGLKSIAGGQTRCPRCGAALVVAPAGGGPLAVGRSCLVSTLGKTHFLLPAGDSRIGRVGSAVMVEDTSVPDFAALLSPSPGGGYLLRDVSGQTQVNGRPVAGLLALRDGDVVRVGRVDLTYHGPSAYPPVASLTPGPPAVAPPPPVVMAPPVVHVPPPGPAIRFPLRDWAREGKPQPRAEGIVRLTTEPARLEDPNLMRRVMAAAALGLIRDWMAALPMGLRRECWMSEYRMENFADGAIYDVVCVDRLPSHAIELGDQVAAWGKEKDGYLMLEEAYIYKSHSRGRTSRPKRRRGGF